MKNHFDMLAQSTLTRSINCVFDLVDCFLQGAYCSIFKPKSVDEQWWTICINYIYFNTLVCQLPLSLQHRLFFSRCFRDCGVLGPGFSTLPNDLANICRILSWSLHKVWSPGLYSALRCAESTIKINQVGLWSEHHIVSTCLDYNTVYITRTCNRLQSIAGMWTGADNWGEIWSLWWQDVPSTEVWAARTLPWTRKTVNPASFNKTK